MDGSDLDGLEDLVFTLISRSLIGNLNRAYLLGFLRPIWLPYQGFNRLKQSSSSK